MPQDGFDVVTGAFGFSGRYITRRLLARGHTVRTLTNSMNRPNPFGSQVEAFSYHFNDVDQLISTLRGAKVFYNTYWVRFDHGDFSHAAGVENSYKLFSAARQAGVSHIVHISITNPSEDSSLPYFKGKALIEHNLIETGLSYAVLRPAVLFGDEGILINNIAWILRHFPVFGIFGDGSYRLQPIYVDDLAELAVEQGEQTENKIIDAIGPETFTYRQLVETIGSAIGKNRPILSIPPALGYWMGWIIGKALGDVLITKDEVAGLMQDLLYTNSLALGKTTLTHWINEHASILGMRYQSELKRRLQRDAPYLSS